MREFVSKVAVRFCEVDSYGVAWHGHYLAWMEVGRSALAEQFGLGVTQLADAGYLGPIIEVEVKYRRPARYNEELQVMTTAVRRETATIAFESRITGGDGSLCATGRTVHALTDLQGVIQYRLPEAIAQNLENLLAWAEAP